MTRIHRSAVVALALAVFAAGCGADGPSRVDVLAEVAETVAVPGYERLATAADALAAATSELCDGPSRGLVDAAIDAVAAARTAWLETEAIWVGPVMARRSWAVVDWPVAPDEIEALIADDEIVLDIDRLSRRIGADQRGLQAVEYVLGSSTVVTDLTAPRRCDYLTGITEVIADEVHLVRADWIESWDDGPAYTAALPDPENGGLDALVNDSLFLLEAMTDMELGRGLGVLEDPSDPDAVVEGSLGLGVADLRARTTGLRRVLLGAEDDGGLVALLDGDLRTRLTARFGAALAAIDSLDGSLRASLTGNRAGVAAVRDALTAIQVTVATEIVSGLGVTIGFSDADGDTG